MLVPQIGMAHLRFDFFSMNKGKKYRPTGTFSSYWASRKKPNGRLKRTYFLEIPGVIKNIFFKKKPKVSKFVALTLEILDKRKLHPLKLPKVQLQPLEIPHFFLIIPRYSTCTCYFLNTTGSSIPSTLCIFFWNSPLHLFKLLFFKFL